MQSNQPQFAKNSLTFRGNFYKTSKIKNAHCRIGFAAQRQSELPLCPANGTPTWGPGSIGKFSDERNGKKTNDIFKPPLSL